METNKGSQFIIATVIIGDLLVINLLFFILPICVGRPLVSEWDVMHNHVMLSLCYLVSMLLFGGVKLHKRRVRADQVVSMVLGGVFGFFVLWLAALGISNVSPNLSWYLITFMVLSLLLVSAYRLTYQFILRQWRKSGSHQCHVVFVGSTRNMMDLYHEMTLNVTAGYNVMGYFDNEENPNFGAKYLGTCDEVTSFVEQNSNIQRLYCSLPSAMKDTILPIMSLCENHMVRFYSVPNLSNYLRRRVNLEIFSNTPILSIRPEPLAKLDSRVVKRTFDIIFSAIFIVTIFPIILIFVSLAIKITSPGPIFFKQKRNGIDGKEFWCYKFRSMHVNKNADTQQACEDDPRKTKFGHFIRSTNIDELPQFINVFLGDMSVVGPRPHMLKHTEEYSQLINRYMVRHLVKPGVTGWAQVSGYRGETRELSDMEGRVRADIWYMEHWTFMLDIYIIYKTITNVICRRDKNAY